MRRLEAALDRAATSRGTTVFLLGEAGSGKTRLAAETMTLAAQRRFEILQGVAYRMHEDLAYAPFLDALGPFLAGRAPAEVSRLTGHLPDLARLFVGLPNSGWPAIADPALERTRLLESVAELLRRMSARGPVLLFLDDMHWADPASLDLLLHLARGIAAHPVVLLVGFRTDPGAPAEELASLLTTVRRLGVVEEIPVLGLAPDEVTTLCGEILGGAPPAELIRGLAQRRVDTPLFVSGLVNGMVDDGDLIKRGGRWVVRPGASLTIPPVIRDLMLDQLDKLDPAHRELMEWVAIAGEAATESLLEQVAGAGTASRLTGLLELGMIVHTGHRANAGIRTFHPLIGEVAYARIPDRTRRHRHSEIALAIERSDPADVERLAHHVRCAGELWPPDQALGVLVAAADRATRVLAHREAVEHLSAAIQAAWSARPAAVAGLLERLGSALASDGRPDEALAAWQDALDRIDSRETGRRARLLGEMSSQLGDQGEFTRAEELMTEAFAVLDGANPESPDAGNPDRLQARVDLWLRRVRVLGRFSSLHDLERTATELGAFAQQTDDYRAAAALHLLRNDIAFRHGLLVEACEHARRAIEAAARTDDPVITAHAHRQLFIGELGLGEIAAADRAHQEDRAQAERSGSQVVIASPRMTDLLRSFATDEWDHGRRLAESTIEFGLRVGSPRAVAAALGYDGWILVQQGRLDEASERILESRRVFPRQPGSDRHIFATIDTADASLHLARGDAPAALKLATAATSIPGLLPCLTFPQLCNALLAVGRPDEAAHQARRLAACGPGRWPTATAQWLAGRVTLAGDDPAAAIEPLRHGMDGLAALGMRFQAARAGLDWACAEGAVGEIDRAVEQARSALRVFEAYEARPLADRARQLLRTLGVRPSVAPRTGAPRTELSDREREVVDLVAKGLSNAEIAQRLFISPRTVTTHLQHVYGRIGVASRTALVRWVLDAEQQARTSRRPPNT